MWILDTGCRMENDGFAGAGRGFIMLKMFIPGAENEHDVSERRGWPWDLF